ncbi:MAG: RNA-binding domain-containing protein [Bacteroidales bacterium]
MEGKKTQDIQDYLYAILSKKESDDLEFKSAAGGFPGSFWDTYSAFANTDGGTIILGVSEKKNGMSLDNLTDELIEKYQKDFWSNVNNRSTISCNLLASNDVIVGDYDGSKMLLFYIPRATAEQRPVYRTTQPYNGTFKRNFEGDYKCTQKEVQRMFADAAYSSMPEDSRILKNYSLDDLDKESLDQYRQLFRTAKPDHPWLALNNVDLLKKLGGYRTDRQTKEEGFTLAALLMFGKYESITDVGCAPDFFPDYRERLTDDPDVRWTNRICPDGTWEVNLFQFYRKVLPRLQAVLQNPFQLKDNIRRDDTSARVSVREALVNLCIHADYSENASLVVLHEKNRFVFSNPGTLLISKEQFFRGGESICRNKSLQKMFMMLGSAEKAESGIDKIMSGWKEANWRSPVIDESVRPDKIVLTMPMESLIDDVVKGKLISQFGNNIMTISHDKLMTLALASTEGFVTNERLRFALRMHKQDITDMLKVMCLNNLLVSSGHGRGTKYRLPESKERSSDANMASSDANMASSDANMASSDANMASCCKKRMSREELDSVIVKKCVDWMSLDSLAEAINRNVKYLRGSILPQMIAEEKIEMLYPGTPTHPNQKYKTKK